MSLLDAKAISMRFGGLLAVDNFSFYVNQGEIVSIIGPNGAGKTTVFNMLTGLYKIQEGEVIFDGKNINNMTPQEIVKAGMARTFQNIRLFSQMRAVENVLIGEHCNLNYNFLSAVFKTKKYRQEEAEKTADAIRILEMLGFGSKINSYASDMPYGDQRKLEIARAIATKAKLLLLDEPAAGMNPHESEELMSFILKIRDMGYTILLIEHDMNVVMNISDRIYVLDYGKEIAHALPHEIRTNPAVIKAYLGGVNTNANSK